jgi:hypothetical protein
MATTARAEAAEARVAAVSATVSRLLADAATAQETIAGAVSTTAAVKALLAQADARIAGLEATSAAWTAYRQLAEAGIADAGNPAGSAATHTSNGPARAAVASASAVASVLSGAVHDVGAALHQAGLCLPHAAAAAGTVSTPASATGAAGDGQAELWAAATAVADQATHRAPANDDRDSDGTATVSAVVAPIMQLLVQLRGAYLGFAAAEAKAASAASQHAAAQQQLQQHKQQQQQQPPPATARAEVPLTSRRGPGHKGAASAATVSTTASAPSVVSSPGFTLAADPALLSTLAALQAAAERLAVRPLQGLQTPSSAALAAPGPSSTPELPRRQSLAGDSDAATSTPLAGTSHRDVATSPVWREAPAAMPWHAPEPLGAGPASRSASPVPSSKPQRRAAGSPLLQPLAAAPMSPLAAGSVLPPPLLPASRGASRASTRAPIVSELHNTTAGLQGERVGSPLALPPSRAGSRGAANGRPASRADGARRVGESASSQSLQSQIGLDVSGAAALQLAAGAVGASAVDAISYGGPRQVAVLPRQRDFGPVGAAVSPVLMPRAHDMWERFVAAAGPSGAPTSAVIHPPGAGNHASSADSGAPGARRRNSGANLAHQGVRAEQPPWDQFAQQFAPAMAGIMPGTVSDGASSALPWMSPFGWPFGPVPTSAAGPAAPLTAASGAGGPGQHPGWHAHQPMPWGVTGIPLMGPWAASAAGHAGQLAGRQPATVAWASPEVAPRHARPRAGSHTRARSNSPAGGATATHAVEGSTLAAAGAGSESARSRDASSTAAPTSAAMPASANPPRQSVAPNESEGPLGGPALAAQRAQQQGQQQHVPPGVGANLYPWLFPFGFPFSAFPTAGWPLGPTGAMVLPKVSPQLDGDASVDAASARGSEHRRRRSLGMTNDGHAVPLLSFSRRLNALDGLAAHGQPAHMGQPRLASRSLSPDRPASRAPAAAASPVPSPGAVVTMWWAWAQAAQAAAAAGGGQWPWAGGGAPSQVNGMGPGGAAAEHRGRRRSNSIDRHTGRRGSGGNSSRGRDLSPAPTSARAAMARSHAPGTEGAPGQHDVGGQAEQLGSGNARPLSMHTDVDAWTVSGTATVVGDDDAGHTARTTRPDAMERGNPRTAQGAQVAGGGASRPPSPSRPPSAGRPRSENRPQSAGRPASAARRAGLDAASAQPPWPWIGMPGQQADGGIGPRTPWAVPSSSGPFGVSADFGGSAAPAWASQLSAMAALMPWMWAQGMQGGHGANSAAQGPLTSMVEHTSSEAALPRASPGLVPNRNTQSHAVLSYPRGRPQRASPERKPTAAPPSVELAVGAPGRAASPTGRAMRRRSGELSRTGELAGAGALFLMHAPRNAAAQASGTAAGRRTRVEPESEVDARRLAGLVATTPAVSPAATGTRAPTAPSDRAQPTAGGPGASIGRKLQPLLTRPPPGSSGGTGQANAHAKASVSAPNHGMPARFSEGVAARPAEQRAGAPTTPATATGTVPDGAPPPSALDSKATREAVLSQLAPRKAPPENSLSATAARTGPTPAAAAAASAARRFNAVPPLARPGATGGVPAASGGHASVSGPGGRGIDRRDGRQPGTAAAPIAEASVANVAEIRMVEPDVVFARGSQD